MTSSRQTDWTFQDTMRRRRDRRNIPDTTGERINLYFNDIKDKNISSHHHHYPARSEHTVAPLIFLAPLAGIAALYALAYVNTNPALLSLVTISGRKKRSLSMEDRITVGEVEDLDYMNEVGKP